MAAIRSLIACPEWRNCGLRADMPMGEFLIGHPSISNVSRREALSPFGASIAVLIRLLRKVGKKSEARQSTDGQR